MYHGQIFRVIEQNIQVSATTQKIRSYDWESWNCVSFWIEILSIQKLKFEPQTHVKTKYQITLDTSCLIYYHKPKSWELHLDF